MRQYALYQLCFPFSSLYIFYIYAIISGEFEKKVTCNRNLIQSCRWNVGETGSIQASVTLSESRIPSGSPLSSNEILLGTVLSVHCPHLASAHISCNAEFNRLWKDDPYFARCRTCCCQTHFHKQKKVTVVKHYRQEMSGLAICITNSKLVVSNPTLRWPDGEVRTKVKPHLQTIAFHKCEQ